MSSSIYPVISRFQRNIERVKDLELPTPGTDLFEETKDDVIIAPINIENHNIEPSRRLPKIANEENSFLDIGLYLDCIGGSRANAFFATPFGYRNTGRTNFNYIFSLSHKTITCAYGENPYNFSSAISDLCVFNKGKDYIVHAVSFNDDMADKVHNDFNPSFAKTRRLYDVKQYNMRELHYNKGLSFYLERLQLLRDTINVKINTYKQLVSSGRKTKIILLFLDNQDLKLLKTDERTRENLEDIVINGHKEKILLIPCVKNINSIPMNTLEQSDMIMTFGSINSKLLQQVKVKGKEKFQLAEEYNEFKTVGLVYDVTSKPNYFPLDGFTKEFHEVKRTLDEWEKHEEEKYFKFLDALDDGSKFDDYNNYTTQYNRDMFSRKDVLDKDLGIVNRLKPIVTFD